MKYQSNIINALWLFKYNSSTILVDICVVTAWTPVKNMKHGIIWENYVISISFVRDIPNAYPNRLDAVY